MDIMANSSSSRQSLSAVDVLWGLWNNFLQNFFKFPTSFKITIYPVFRFNHSCSGALHTKDFSFSKEEMSFNRLKRVFLLDYIRRQEGQVWTNACHVPHIKSLSDVSSAQHGIRDSYLIQNFMKPCSIKDENMAGNFFRTRTSKD